MSNELVTTVQWHGKTIEIYRLVTPFGGFLSAYVDGAEVKRGPMLTVEMAIETAKVWIAKSL